ncbi:hypothetical protein PLIIFM63780_006708 [Purpureocillium lilacinum]|uniref:Cytochrome P450 n=1 Tax=Purpureocillium lilacinum TaxID=33203 RepID=A0ABR0BQQ4_PURLI|nr:hypothetical protein Purlil1_9230 [Purpureocillium lilacinum]GJN72645.1 hypothetical protein PLICBS_006720 [Purpureocillium lilacinum]GJN83160.1 hypothetical protein PLIIFM63780_006708 [Purpureocillium lilacinum]
MANLTESAMLDQLSGTMMEERQRNLGPILMAATALVVVLLSSMARYLKSVSKQVNLASFLGKPLRNIPQVTGYPLLGILPQMCREGLYSSAMKSLFDAAKDSGISSSSAVGIPVVFVRDPAIIRQVLVHNSNSITRLAPDGSGPFNIMQRITGTIAASANGEDWHRWRKGFLKDFSNATALRQAYDDIRRIAKRHVQAMRDAKSGSDLGRVMEAYALDTVWSVTIGDDTVSKSSADITDVMSGYGDIVGSPSHLWRHFLRNFFAFKSFQDPDHVERNVGEQINGVLHKLLNRNLANLDPETLYCDGRKNNFLRNTSKESGGTSDLPVTQDVLAQARQVFSLGHEAPTLLLVWAIYELSLHPDVITKLRQEILQYMPDNGDLDFETLRSMPYLDAVTSELLRMHPPISTTSRIVTEPIPVQTRTNDAAVIPAGAHLFASIHLLHHDKLVWGDNADEFVPERWEGLRASAAESRCEYMPFLAGPRGCPSSNFVMVQMKTMLVELLTQVDIELPNSTGLEKCIGGVVKPSRPVEYSLKEICV